MTDARFEVLCCLSAGVPALVDEIAEDCGIDAYGLIDALAAIVCMDVGLVFCDDNEGFLESVLVCPDCWHRAKFIAEAYHERTYGC